MHRQQWPRGVELRLDEPEHRVARLARARRDLDLRGDRHAAERVHQHVVVECPQRPGLGRNGVAGREGHVGQRPEQRVGACNSGKGDDPDAVSRTIAHGADRGPRLVVHLEPDPAVIPVRATRRDDHLVAADFAQVVVVVERTAQLGVNPRQAAEHFPLVAVEVVRRNGTGGVLVQIGAPQHEQQRRAEEQQCEAPRCLGHKRCCHRRRILRTWPECRPSRYGGADS